MEKPPKPEIVETPAIPPIETEAETAIDEADEVDSLEEALHAEAIICEERHGELLSALEQQGQNLRTEIQNLNQSVTQSQATDSPALAQIQAQQTEMLAQLAQLTTLAESLRNPNQSPRHKNSSSESIPEIPSSPESTPQTPPVSETPEAGPEKTPSRRRVRVV